MSLVGPPKRPKTTNIANKTDKREKEKKPHGKPLDPEYFKKYDHEKIETLYYTVSVVMNT